MLEIREVLFPVDFSPQCRSVAPHVKALAERFGARLTLIHVLQIPHQGYLPYGARLVAEEKARVRESIAAAMRDFMQASGLQARCAIEEGDPGHAVALYAGRHQTGLIMLPTHGYGPFRRMLIGSVTAKILHDAGCPVWTSAHIEQPQAAPQPYKTIACAAEREEWARSFAERYGAEVKTADLSSGASGIRADLLVIGRHHALQLVRESPCPVISV
jgi:nucleotide-binding universal stress UspA family protein